MAQPGPEKLPVQLFRLHPTSNIVTIPPRLDHGTGKHIILWEDIQASFRNPQYVMSRGNIVEFLTDDNRQHVLPKRINCQSGVVLDVVAESDEQGVAAAATAISLKQSVTPVFNVIRELSGAAPPRPRVDNESSDAFAEPADDILEPAVATHEVVVQERSNSTCGSSSSISESSPTVPAATTKKVLETDLVTGVTKKKNAKQSSYQLAQFLCSYVDTGMPDETIHTDSVRNTLIERFNVLQAGLHIDKTGLDRMLQAQNHIQDRQVLLQNMIQSLINQSYETNESPLPRLFIVLLVPQIHEDKTIKPPPKQFRLFFLCECETHTMTEESRFSYKIHLTEHQGYSLDRQDEFFEKYGSYVLTIMTALKYSVGTDGVVPALLSHFAESLYALEKRLNLPPNESFGLLDETIQYIEEQQRSQQQRHRNAISRMNMDMGQTNVDVSEVLDGADLRELGSFLDLHDRNLGGAGNLIRAATAEGHIKWFCADHYLDNFPDGNTQRLQGFLTYNGGAFQLRFLHIRPGSRVRAKQFYSALAEIHLLQKLSISFRWSVTMDDMREMAAAVVKANVTHLTLYGGSFGGGALDTINNGRRYDPILQLMSNGRIQSMGVMWIDSFLKHISNSAITTCSQLLALRIRAVSPTMDLKSRKSLSQLLQNCPLLDELEIGGVDLYYGYKFLENQPSLAPNLRTLKLTNPSNSLFNMGFTRYRTQITRAVLHLQSDRDPNDQKLLRSGFLTRFRAAVPPGTTAAEVADVMHLNSNLIKAEFDFELPRSPTVVDQLISAKNDVLLSQGHSSMENIILSFGGSIVMTLDYTDTMMAPNISTKVDIKHFDTLTDTIAVIAHCAWSVISLVVNEEFTDDHAETMDRGTEDKGSKLQGLILNPGSLTKRGLKCMDRLIGCSKDLELTFKFHKLHERDEQEKMEWILSRQGKRLKNLYLETEGWIPSKIVPTRLDLPCLEVFQLVANRARWDEQKISKGLNEDLFGNTEAEWIAAMVSAPPFQSGPPSTSQYSLTTSISESPPGSLSCDLSYLQPEACAPWTSLTSIHLQLDLTPWAWRKIIEAIDFSMLKTLALVGCNILQEEFKLLVDRIPEESNRMVPLYVDASRTKLQGCTRAKKDELFARLMEKVPEALVY